MAVEVSNCISVPPKPISGSRTAITIPTTSTIICGLTVSGNITHIPVFYFQGWNGSTIVFWSSTDINNLPGGVTEPKVLAVI